MTTLLNTQLAMIDAGIEEERETFVSELQSKFGHIVSLSNTFELWAKLVTTVQCNYHDTEAIQRELLILVDTLSNWPLGHINNDKIPKIFAIHCVEVRKRQMYSALQYFTLLFGSFLYAKKTNRMDLSFYCTLSCLPCHRLALDIDVDSNICNMNQDAIIVYILQRLPSTMRKHDSVAYVISKRFNYDTDNFHLIFDQQFDSITAKGILHNLLLQIENNIGVSVDAVDSWSLPGGRSHSINGQDANKTQWTNIRQLSIVDIWSCNAFSMLKLLPVNAIYNNNELRNSIHNCGDEEQDQINALCYLRAIANDGTKIDYIYNDGVAIDNFFVKFIDYPELNYINSSNRECTKFKNDDLILTYINTRATTNEHGENDNDGNDSICYNDGGVGGGGTKRARVLNNVAKEFYELYEYTEFTLKTPLINIFMKVKANMQNKMDTTSMFNAYNRDINAVRDPAQISAETFSAINAENMAFLNVQAASVMNTPFAETIDEYNDIFFGGASFPNMNLCMVNFMCGLREKDANLYLHLIFLYIRYCKEMEIAPCYTAASEDEFHRGTVDTDSDSDVECEANEFESAFHAVWCHRFSVAIASPLAHKVVRSYMHVDKFYNKYNELICKIFHHILKMMLEAGHVTALLALTLKYKIFTRNQLLCSIGFLLAICNSNAVIVILYKYISGIMKAHANVLSEHIALCFPINPMAHFLWTGIVQSYNISTQQIYDIYKTCFATQESLATQLSNNPSGAPRRTNQRDTAKMNANFTSVIEKFFLKYVLCICWNGAHFYGYINNKYQILEITQQRFVEFETKSKVGENDAWILKEEPSHFAFWYRRERGIYMSVSGLFESHSPALASMIFIKTMPKLLTNYNNHVIYNSNNWNIKNFIFDTFLKALHFARICELNKTACTLLGALEAVPSPPLVQHDCTTTAEPETTTTHTLQYETLIQSLPSDFMDKHLYLPIDRLIEKLLLPECDALLDAFRYLYMILSTLSKHCALKMHNPAKLIDDLNGLLTSELKTSSTQGTAHPHQDESVQQLKNNKNGLNWSDDEITFMQHVQRVVLAKSLSAHHHHQNNSTMTSEMEQETSSSSVNNSRAAIIDISEPTMAITNTVLSAGKFEITSRLLNIFILRQCLCGVVGSSIKNNINIKEICEGDFRFTFFILSWLIRKFETAALRANQHLFCNTSTIWKNSLFSYLATYSHTLMDNLRIIVLSVCGPPITASGLCELTQYFKAFAENSTLHVNSFEGQQLLKIGSTDGYYSLNAGSVDDVLALDIYTGVCSLLMDAQFSEHMFVDLFKLLTSFVHRGNTARECVALLNRTATGKNVFVNSILQLFRTQAQQQFNDDDLQSCARESGNSLCLPLNQNLLVAFDEVTKLTSVFKTLTNFGILSERPFFTQKRYSLRINSHIIIASNADPQCSDAATLARICPLDRKLQFVMLEKNLFISRNNSISTGTLDPINELLGAQLLMERLPKSSDIEAGLCGLHFLVWHCWDIFLHDMSLPVSSKKSIYILNARRRFLYAAHPTRYILENKIISFSSNKSLTIEEFDQLTTNKLKQLKCMFTSNFQVSTVLAELKDQLAKYIYQDRIYVQFNDSITF